MKRLLIMCVVFVFTLAMLAACTIATAASESEGEALATGEHPIDMGNMECITCHADEEMVMNPDVVVQYNQSLHSFAGVACGNCHGDATDFAAVPVKAACEPCHAEQVAVINSEEPCQSCHTVHTFAVHMKQ